PFGALLGAPGRRHLAAAQRLSAAQASPLRGIYSAMRRILTTTMFIAAALALAAAALADPGDKGKGKAQGKNKFSFQLVNTNKSKHGHLIRAGVTGRFGGYLEGTITGGTFNKKATCAAACFTSDFITAFFGAGATFSCDVNSTDCKFNFNYTAPSRSANRPR